MAGLDLDQMFGPVLSKPAYTRDVERDAQLSLICELNAAIARDLAMLSELANSSPLFRPVALGLCLLWVVDVSGRVLIGLEMVCEKDLLHTHYPRMRGVPLDASVDSLGHPLLVQNGGARIGGELFLDTDGHGGPWGWVVSNKSGRYGFGEHRQEQHLNNVANAFVQAGVPVTTHYLRG